MNKLCGEASGRRWLGLAALVVALAAGAGVAQAQTKISSCSSGPFTISSGGFYRVTANLTAAMNKDCIDIKASNVVLDLHGFTITGNAAVLGGGASGVNVLPGNNFAVIEGADNFIQAFDVGIQDQGSYATIEDINTVNNRTSGVWLNDPSYSQVTNTDSFVANPGAISQKYGIRVTSAFSAGVGDGVLEANAIYGLWIEKSTQTRVWNVFSENNVQTSIYLGCSSNGYIAVGTSCPSNKTYGDNIIYDDVTDNSDPLGLGAGATAFGLAIDKSELGDSIFQNVSHDNLEVGGDINTPTSFDPNCTKNLYFLNNQEPPGPGSVSPACVQNN
jgi:hypothetical protein